MICVDVLNTVYMLYLRDVLYMFMKNLCQKKF